MVQGSHNYRGLLKSRDKELADLLLVCIYMYMYVEPIDACPRHLSYIYNVSGQRPEFE